jgi:predicted PurR-regulated permease PerM
VPAGLVAATQSWQQALATALLYLLIQQLENHLLAPRIMGHAVRVHPVAIIASLLAGAALLGLVGALLAVPVAAAVAVALEDARRGEFPGADAASGK